MKKRCIRCGETKPLSEFHRSKAEKDGHVGKCKPCVLAYQRERWKEERVRLLDKTRRRGTKSRATREARELRRYGLTQEAYASILAEQNGVCAICQRTEITGRRMPVDHCHVTQAVRGILCTRCNTAIGLLKDDVGILSAAIAYLSRPIERRRVA